MPCEGKPSTYNSVLCCMNASKAEQHHWFLTRRSPLSFLSLARSVQYLGSALFGKFDIPPVGRCIAYVLLAPCSGVFAGVEPVRACKTEPFSFVTKRQQWNLQKAGSSCAGFGKFYHSKVCSPQGRRCALDANPGALKFGFLAWGVRCRQTHKRKVILPGKDLTK